MILPPPEYMATWVMGEPSPASLKKTRSPGRRSDLSTPRPACHCPIGLSGSVSHLSNTRLVRQEQSSGGQARRGRRGPGRPPPRPAGPCPIGLAGSVSHLSNTRLVRQEQSSER